MRLLSRSERGYLLIYTLILTLILTLLAVSLAGIWHWRFNLQKLLRQHLEIETLMVSGIAMAHLITNNIPGEKNDIWLELPPPDTRSLFIAFNSNSDGGFEVMIKNEGKIVESYIYNH